MKKIQLTKGKTALIDDKDYDRICRYKWQASLRGSQWYAITTIFVVNKKKTILMHRFILGMLDSESSIDHLNGDGLDNTRKNMRTANKHQNGCNRGKQANNKSGYKGVSVSYNGKWQASIKVYGKSIGLGHYNCPKEAARAYDKGAKKYHGEFARLNFA